MHATLAHTPGLVQAIILSITLVLGSCASAPAEQAEVDDVVVEGAEEALEVLLEGNRRFVAGHSRHAHESARRRAMLSTGQHPFAIVLGCADSRVPPELLFDAGFGDLFVIRVAGNVAGQDEAGSIEYAVEHLNTPLVLVLGHEGCGAVTAAMGSGHADEIEELSRLLAEIVPAVEGIDPALPEEQRVQLGVEANVRQSMARLKDIQERVGSVEQKARVVGAVYELETGLVRVLEP